ncbi:MAG: hypothetical protein ACM3L6_05680 [Deltaproteobacteria bacterium]
MLPGIVFILAGILIAVYPPFLALIVASVLILTGVGLLAAGYNYRRMSRDTQDPFIHTFFRI